ncbi:hypothetical protein [Govanella unica]|uniref:Uncharacterized protein n=1 Tax=Govanella unica TaxID=2975056 RepID=A0A9X3Z872_9PROT|nr:hypothetical protein [Govania unica]MDA5195045.1 hypothetical protein [Govania unica]
MLFTFTLRANAVDVVYGTMRRYARGQEWFTITKRLWAEDLLFDFAGEPYNLKKSSAIQSCCTIACPSSMQRAPRKTANSPPSRTRAGLTARTAACLTRKPRPITVIAPKTWPVFRGTTLCFVDYVKELPYFRDEVLPRLEARGVRLPL